MCHLTKAREMPWLTLSFSRKLGQVSSKRGADMPLLFRAFAGVGGKGG